MQLVARVEDERRVEGLVGRVVVDEVLVETRVAVAARPRGVAAVLRVDDPEVLAVPVRVRGQAEQIGLLRAAEAAELVVVADRSGLVRRDAGRAEDVREVEYP